MLGLAAFGFSAEILAAADNQTAMPAGWRAEDSLAIVPLHPLACTGVIAPVLEEGLIAAGKSNNKKLHHHR